jgi:hypothetical protein
VPRIDRFLPLIDPLLILWDNHDMREVHTHGLVFEMEVGEAGRLFVTSLNHVGQENAAGRWLLNQWLNHLSTPVIPPRLDAATREATLARLVSELGRQSLPLHAEPWKFRPDPEQTGHTDGWFHVDWDDAKWDSIRVDAHWDGQGYGDLDKWGWYRTRVTLPNDWHSPRTYLNFTGIDDYADIYVNGQKVGTAGNIETKTTAFEERVSLDITPFVQDSRELQITVAVYDWYGAGGIFRPVTLSTTPVNQDPPILK